jgi:signal transduction histidine kinase
MLLDEHDAVMDRTAGATCDMPARRFARAAAAGQPSSSTICGPAGISMENRLLRAQLHAQNEELRASRARLVAAGDAERRRLERNLHDGAQSRFVAIALHLGRAKGKLAPDDEVAGILDRAIGELALALDELRELARGLHPALLTDRGLDAALAALAARAPLPVEIEGAVGGRLDEPVEIAAYFAVSEALTNVAKYADAGSATVRMCHDGGRLVVEVHDDGRGGARPEDGSGLRGIADRLGALDGRLSVDSPAGEGTRLRAEIPCPAPSGR